MSVCAQAFVAPVLPFTGMCAPGITLRSSGLHSKRPCLPNHLASPQGGFVVSLWCWGCQANTLARAILPAQVTDFNEFVLVCFACFYSPLEQICQARAGEMTQGKVPATQA